jgi:ferric-dicitrate binding protein FerR (iron transport regulator)
VVHTPFYDVNVTGTQFNVKAYDTDTEITTTLEKGQVTIQSSENFRLAEDIILKPGEQLVLNKETNAANIKTVNTKWFTSWKDNKLIFVNMSMKELVMLLNRKYGVEIEVQNKEILDLHFDGTIKNESVIEILEILKKTLPIDYKIEGQKIEISNNNN